VAARRRDQPRPPVDVFRQERRLTALVARWLRNPFTSDRDGTAQLYVLSLRGGEAEKLTDRKERVGSFRWSPDGSRIALLMNEAKPEALEKREKDRDDARVVDKDERFERVWLLDVKTRRLLQATAGPWQIDQIEWMPDGRSLIALANDKPQVDAWLDRLYRIDLEHPTDGTFHEIAAPRGPVGNLAVSPDGQTIAYIGARRRPRKPRSVSPTGQSRNRPEHHARHDRSSIKPGAVDRRSVAHSPRAARLQSTLAVVNRGASLCSTASMSIHRPTRDRKPEQ
jgi:dipeptidyl aminopeptidase/acylaminoacyl peptidase